ncbi:acyl-CoA dehydrogenase family protein [Ideonella sp. DXS22W]|uniref:Acyl-CoA dehydrogenase family protein n=1 Tax=Pseudaquabacterium inlustre TaxID=2984192 RepID=A0ABU9CHT7_9BURK
MDFNYSDEQQQLAESLRKFLGAQYGFDQRKAIVHSASGASDSVWATFAEMGLTAIALPEEDGGFGGGAVDLMAAMEACGEALVVEPLLDNVGLAGRLVARTGSAAQRAALLPGLADGTRRLAFAYLEPGRRYAADPQATTAKRDGDGWVLNGAKTVVIGAPLAHTLIVSAATPEGASLFIVDPAATGVAASPCRTVDGQRAADLRFEGVRLGADALLGTAGGAQAAIDEALDFATALLCAEAVGAMRYAVDATLEYTKTRKQFGVAIASFQVLQHRMVEMHIHTEQARSMAILAASRVDGTDASPAAVRERQRAVSAAKVKIADAARLVSQEAVQLHGGMGMTEEMKVSHTFRRLTMLAQRFGDADHHLARFARVS